MSALSIPLIFQPALLPPSYEIFLYHPLIKFLTSIYYLQLVQLLHQYFALMSFLSKKLQLAAQFPLGLQKFFNQMLSKFLTFLTAQLKTRNPTFSSKCQGLYLTIVKIVPPTTYYLGILQYYFLL